MRIVRDLLRQNYIQMLLSSGVRGEELEQALAAIERVDRRLNEEVDPQAGLEQRTQAHLRAWAEAQGLDDESLTEEEWFKQVQRGIAEVRKRETR